VPVVARVPPEGDEDKQRDRRDRESAKARGGQQSASPSLSFARGHKLSTLLVLIATLVP
jgi:hypothetical protein